MAGQLADGPKAIADLFDLQRFPGKRGLQKSPVANLEFALVADGVPPAEVYNVLRTEEGIERAFKKLDSIKKDVVWWETGVRWTRLVRPFGGLAKVDRGCFYAASCSVISAIA